MSKYLVRIIFDDRADVKNVGQFYLVNKKTLRRLAKLDTAQEGRYRGEIQIRYDKYIKVDTETNSSILKLVCKNPLYTLKELLRFVDEDEDAGVY